MLLKGRNALITGGTSGIGKAMVEVFTEEGANVVFSGRREELGRDIVSRLGRHNVHYIKCDLRDPGQVEELVNRALDKVGNIDILVNNAGSLLLDHIENITYEDFVDIYKVNLYAPFLLMKMVLPHMKQKGRGVVINISSIAGLSPYPRGGVYCSSKAALISLSKVAALEYAGHGVRVVVIAPGLVDTPMIYLGVAEGERRRYREAMCRRVPLGRIATPREIAELAAYLASDKARQITGSVFVIDGGTIAGRPSAAVVEKE